MVNEAALFAARQGDKKVEQEHIDLARDKVMMGPERKSMIMTDEQKRITAYHESGHAIVGRLMPEHDPVYKVTIIPRGREIPRVPLHTKVADVHEAILHTPQGG